MQSPTISLETLVACESRGPMYLAHKGQRGLKLKTLYKGVEGDVLLGFIESK